MATDGITTSTGGNVLDEDLDKFLPPTPAIDSRIFGPYAAAYRLTILGWCAGTGGDDDSTADLAMFINGNSAGSQSLKGFKTYYLHVTKTIRLEAGWSASVTISHTNEHGPTETGYSIDLIGLERA
jgi:hypothetical protein